MKAGNAVRNIRLSPDGANWALSLDGVSQAIFRGRAARERALEAALRLAETLRPEAPVLVVVETPDQPRPVRIARMRLAS